jgi:hypothetical protein
MTDGPMFIRNENNEFRLDVLPCFRIGCMGEQGRSETNNITRRGIEARIEDYGTEYVRYFFEQEGQIVRWLCFTNHQARGPSALRIGELNN